MPNGFKYNTSTESLALKRGNFYIATGDVGKGPTSTSGFYNGITPPAGGYTIYVNKASNGPSIYVAANDSELISVTNKIAGTSYSTATQCLSYFAEQTDKVVLNRDYEGLITNGLVFNLDAGFTPSYPKTNTTWYDIGGSTNGNLTNGPSFSSTDGGYINFDGADDAVIQYTTNLSAASGTKTVLCWCWPDSTGPANTYTGLVSWGGRGNSNPSDSILLSLNTNSSTWYVSSAYWYNDYLPDNLSVNKNAWNMVGIIARQQSTPNSNNTTLICGNSNGLSYSTGNSSDVNRSISTTNSNLSIGSTDIISRVFKGRIAIVLIYSRELSTNEITQIYNTYKSRFGL